MQGLKMSFFNHKITNCLPCKKINKMNVSLLSSSWFLVLYGAKLASFSYTSMKIWDMSLAFLQEIIKSWLSLFFNWTSFSLADSSSPKNTGECVTLFLKRNAMKKLLQRALRAWISSPFFSFVTISFCVFEQIVYLLWSLRAEAFLHSAYQGKKSWYSAAHKWQINLCARKTKCKMYPLPWAPMRLQQTTHLLVCFQNHRIEKELWKWLPEGVCIEFDPSNF